MNSKKSCFDMIFFGWIHGLCQVCLQKNRECPKNNKSLTGQLGGWKSHSVGIRSIGVRLLREQKLKVPATLCLGRVFGEVMGRKPKILFDVW